MESRNLSDQVLEKRFTKQVLQQNAQELRKGGERLMQSRGFDNNDWYTARSFTVTEDILGYTHLKKHRFVDMKTRKTQSGIIKKKNHPVHNKIIFGIYNNIIRELMYGYTEAVKQELRQINDF